MGYFPSSQATELAQTAELKTKSRRLSQFRLVQVAFIFWVFIVATYLAFSQEVHVDAYRRPGWSELNGWLAPLETNPTARLPSVGTGLKQVFALDKNRVCIVGDQGLMMWTTDGGRNWSIEPLSIPRIVTAPPIPPPAPPIEGAAPRAAAAVKPSSGNGPMLSGISQDIEHRRLSVLKDAIDSSDQLALAVDIPGSAPKNAPRPPQNVPNQAQQNPNQAVPAPQDQLRPPSPPASSRTSPEKTKAEVPIYPDLACVHFLPDGSCGYIGGQGALFRCQFDSKDSKFKCEPVAAIFANESIMWLRTLSPNHLYLNTSDQNSIRFELAQVDSAPEKPLTILNDPFKKEALTQLAVSPSSPSGPFSLTGLQLQNSGKAGQEFQVLRVKNFNVVKRDTPAKISELSDPLPLDNNTWSAFLDDRQEAWILTSPADASSWSQTSIHLLPPETLTWQTGQLKVQPPNSSDLGRWNLSSLRDLEVVHSASPSGQESGSRQAAQSVGHRAWLCGDQGLILGTVDSKDPWYTAWEQQVSDTQDDLVGCSFADVQTGWIIGRQGTVLATTDGGRTWVHQTTKWVPNQDKSSASKSRTGSNAAVFGSSLVALMSAEDLKFPGMWYYLTIALLGGWLYYLERNRLHEEVTDTAGRPVDPDRPLGPGDRDVLGTTEIANGLARFLANENVTPPLTVAITGGWGTGKSSLMNILQSRLKSFGFRCIWFNAWHHQKEDHLLASLLEQIQQHASPPWRQPLTRVRFHGHLLLRRIGKQPLIAFLLLAVYCGLGAYFVSHEGGVKAANRELLAKFRELLGALLGLTGKGDVDSPLRDSIIALLNTCGVGGGAVGILVPLFRGLQAFGMRPGEMLSGMIGLARPKDLDKQVSFRSRFARDFQDVTEALAPYRLVIFIDDLDRCQPENVAEVLEAINYLNSSGKCFVVLGMDRGPVEVCIGLRFEHIAEHVVANKEDGLPRENVNGVEPDDQQSDEERARKKRQRQKEFARSYLEKLINLEIPVPTMHEPQAAQLMAPSSNAVAPQTPATSHTHTTAWKSLLVRSSRLIGDRVDRYGQWLVVMLLLGLGIGGYLLTPQSSAPIVTMNGGAGAPPARVSSVRNTLSPVDTDDHQPAPGTRPSPLVAPRKNLADATSPAVVRPGLMQVSPVSVALCAMLACGLVIAALRSVWVYSRVLFRDPDDFARSLSIWNPVVLECCPTPRTYKRFMNRVRYLAMRQQSQSEPRPTLGQRWSSWVSRLFDKTEPQRVESTHPQPRETVLFGYCALESLRAHLESQPQHPHWFSRFDSLQKPLVGESLPPDIAAGDRLVFSRMRDHNQLRSSSPSLLDVLETHRKVLTKLHSPAPIDELHQIQKLVQEVRVH